MKPYGGNALLFPTTFDIPDDSDPPAAATFNVAGEALGDRTAFLGAAIVPLADLNALAAIDTTAYPLNAIRTVVLYGPYLFNPTAGYTEDRPIVVKPVVGPGFWVQMVPRGYYLEFTASGTWTCPPNLTRVLLIGWGGGGGGGAGAGSATMSDPTHYAGGGGRWRKARRRTSWWRQCSPGLRTRSRLGLVVRGA